MEYSIRELADMAGISTRTLRWYDRIGLLKPSRIGDNSYRYYAEAEADRLQHILFYRALGVELAQIRRLLDDPAFDRNAALHDHLNALLEERSRIDALISTVQRTIDAEERKTPLMNHEKFEGFKKKLVADNETAYGAEARKRYGNDAVDASNQKMLGMTQEQYDEWTSLGREINDRLAAAVRTGELPEGTEGAEIASLHRRWLMFTWKTYSSQAHAGVARMYVCDDRFRDYYDAEVPGCAQFLCDAVLAFTASR